ncbi:MAG: hypothetical protein RID53_28270 [Coleofasciculus sp. B1-GNL1-01]
MDAIAWNISWFGGGDRAGFVVLLGVCIIIESLNPPLHDWGDWRAIAWNISWFGGGDRAGFVVLWGVLSDDLIPKPAPTGWG